MTNPNDDNLSQWAQKTIAGVHRWGIIYWTLHNWFALISLAVSIAIPFCLAVMIYRPQLEWPRWNAVLLGVSASGLVLQVLGSVLRFRERAYQKLELAHRLEGDLLEYRSGLTDKTQFMKSIRSFLQQLPTEPGP